MTNEPLTATEIRQRRKDMFKLSPEAAKRYEQTQRDMFAPLIDKLEDIRDSLFEGRGGVGKPGVGPLVSTCQSLKFHNSQCP